MTEVYQFKLNSGEDIIAEVMSYADENVNMITLKSAMKLVLIQTEDNNYQYILKPWMILQLDMNKPQLLNPSAIAGQAIPSNELLNQYEQAVNLTYASEQISKLEEQEENDSNITHFPSPKLLN